MICATDDSERTGVFPLARRSSEGSAIASELEFAGLELLTPVLASHNRFICYDTN